MDTETRILKEILDLTKLIEKNSESILHNSKQITEILIGLNLHAGLIVNLIKRVEKLEGRTLSDSTGEKPE